MFQRGFLRALFCLYCIIPFSLSAQTAVPSGDIFPDVWDDVDAQWENGQPVGYAEGETAAMVVKITTNSTASLYVDLCLETFQTVPSTRYAFTDFSSWDTTFQPTTFPDGSPLTVNSVNGPVELSNGTITSVTAPTLGQGECDPEYFGLRVTFTKTVGASPAWILYGGLLATPGAATPTGSPDATVPAGSGASSINGTFQSRIAGAGDKTINFKGDDIIADVCGDGIVAVGEQCDDGNITNGDGCSAACECGLCGCYVSEADTDGDGTVDCLDGCPSDPGKTNPGVCGCGTSDVDSDGDGTPDCNDGCPNDEDKTAPGVCGCGVSDVDTDSDGTPNCNDQCPNDPGKVVPGACGCGVSDADTDGDGTPDCSDNCPNDPNKMSPGVCGCGIADTDSDGDGVADCNDLCPQDSNKSDPGICGCGTADTDSDGDGVADCNDLCPQDPNKTSPGVCGCGTADTDTDGDGTPNCNDQCPTDPTKTAPGACGCGVSDADTDQDGTPDCSDNCPNDPNKMSPGICGCGVSDADSDGDGTVDCQDLCVRDPNKSDPGVCGCHVADVDTDGDGTADCIDLCPADPNKTSPGICGCGLADGDADNDEIPDCSDNCPNDPTKGSPGQCGCGVPDVDSDGDGILDCRDPNCDDTDITNTQFALDGSSFKQRALVKKAAKALLAKGGESQRKYVNKVIKQADALHLANWNLIWSIPSIQTQCDNSNLCVNSDQTGAIGTFNSNASQLDALLQSVVKRTRKVTGQRFYGTALVVQSQNLLSSELTLSATVPAFTSSCTI